MDTETGAAAECVAESRELQPVDVSHQDLADFAQSEAAKRLERLEADRELILQLSLRGFAGPEWNRFAQVLAAYGFQVICAWIWSGLIFAKCTAKGRGLSKVPEITRSLEDAQEIACDTVGEAIHAFREKVLIPGRWDPTRGASLKTFFIGQCIFQFPNVYRRWVKDQGRLVPVDAETLAKELEWHSPQHSTETLAEFARAVTTIRALPDDHPRKIEALMAMGYSQLEIAELLNTTEKAIEMKLYRHRQSQKGSLP